MNTEKTNWKKLLAAVARGDLLVGAGAGPVYRPNAPKRAAPT